MNVARMLAVLTRSDVRGNPLGKAEAAQAVLAEEAGFGSVLDARTESRGIKAAARNLTEEQSRGPVDKLARHHAAAVLAAHDSRVGTGDKTKAATDLPGDEQSVLDSAPSGEAGIVADPFGLVIPPANGVAAGDSSRDAALEHPHTAAAPVPPEPPAAPLPLVTPPVSAASGPVAADPFVVPRDRAEARAPGTQAEPERPAEQLAPGNRQTLQSAVLAPEAQRAVAPIPASAIPQPGGQLAAAGAAFRGLSPDAKPPAPPPVPHRFLSVETHFTPVASAVSSMPVDQYGEEPAAQSASGLDPVEEHGGTIDKPAPTIRPLHLASATNTDASEGKPGLSPAAAPPSVSGDELAAAGSGGAPSAVRQLADRLAPLMAPPDAPPGASSNSSALPAGPAPLRILHIQLEPVDLGAVKATLRVAGGRLEVSLEAERTETAELLRHDKDALARLLRSSGHGPASIVVQIAEAQPVAQQSQQQGQPVPPGSQQPGAQYGLGDRGAAGQERSPEGQPRSPTSDNREARHAPGRNSSGDLRSGVYL